MSEQRRLEAQGPRAEKQLNIERAGSERPQSVRPARKIGPLKEAHTSLRDNVGAAQLTESLTQAHPQQKRRSFGPKPPSKTEMSVSAVSFVVETPDTLTPSFVQGEGKELHFGEADGQDGKPKERTPARAATNARSTQLVSQAANKRSSQLEVKKTNATSAALHDETSRAETRFEEKQTSQASTTHASKLVHDEDVQTGAAPGKAKGLPSLAKRRLAKALGAVAAGGALVRMADDRAASDADDAATDAQSFAKKALRPKPEASATLGAVSEAGEGAVAARTESTKQARRAKTQVNKAVARMRAARAQASKNAAEFAKRSAEATAKDQNILRVIAERFKGAFYASDAAAIGAAAGAGGAITTAVAATVSIVLVIAMMVPMLIIPALHDADTRLNLEGLGEAESEVALVLYEQGYGTASIAAIMGNIKQESGFDPRAGYPDGVACGLAQWGNHVDGSGWQALVAWAESEHLDPLSATTQTHWLARTIRGALDTYSGTGHFYFYANGTRTWWPERVTLDQFKAMEDPELAAEIFCNTYERPSVPMMDARKRYAREYYDLLSRRSAADGNVILQAAYSQLGVPYVWGGHTPFVGLDCSGFTSYCYGQAGISITPYTESQYVELTRIPLAEAQPGDILYRFGHVAIYIGGDEYIHEPQTGDVCKISRGINYFTCALRYTG